MPQKRSSGPDKNWYRRFYWMMGIGFAVFIVGLIGAMLVYNGIQKSAHENNHTKAVLISSSSDSNSSENSSSANSDDDTSSHIQEIKKLSSVDRVTDRKSMIVVTMSSGSGDNNFIPQAMKVIKQYNRMSLQKKDLVLYAKDDYVNSDGDIDNETSRLVVFNRSEKTDQVSGDPNSFYNSAKEYFINPSDYARFAKHDKSFKQNVKNWRYPSDGILVSHFSKQMANI
ncbi:hypothetical protein [Levilactobacillus tujiorum]|uniref:hypothetical protein n=1 Tax=Levilactobacillus tujiorum TaxID=2912243 RepID=UPI0014576D32|nr:hypothetical protein [Levilactobacillus tujiorum]NLR32247.1 hypothetical protein [Levilactobacillus tujiorum]